MLDVGNTFAKMTYFDSPDFKGNRQAFVFYPEAESNRWSLVMEKLRGRDLKVSYIWYPEPDAEYIEQVPDGVEVLPYLYLENLPKNADFHQIIVGLPHIVNMRFMDVSYKDDKWAFIYLGNNVDRQLRRNLIMGLRSKSFNGYPLYASELMATTTAEFPSPQKEMAVETKPLCKEIAPAVAAFRSEFLFLSDVPQPLGHGKILHFIKSTGVKLARVYFIETVEHLKRGFLHLPALTETEWRAAVTALREHYFHAAGFPDGCGSRIEVEEVWFQPHGAGAPNDPEACFLLTDYYFLYNIPRGVSEQLLVHGCGLNRVRIQLFDPTTPEPRPTRIGFAVRLASAPDRQAVEEALESIRGKRFGESAVFVDRIWLSKREPEEVGRIRLSLKLGLRRQQEAEGEAEEQEAEAEARTVEICSTRKAMVPQLTKVPMFFLHGLPADFDETGLLENVHTARVGSLSRSLNATRSLFIQPFYGDRHSWCSALATIYVFIADSRLGAEVNEVFREDPAFVGEMPEGMVRSCLLLISNLPVDAPEEQVLDNVPHIEESAVLLPSPATEQSRVVLLSTSDEADISDCVSALRSKTLSGRRPNVMRLWLSSVEPHGLWPSYRAPCQADEAAEVMDAEEKDRLQPEDSFEDMSFYDVAGDGDNSEANGARAPPSCVVVDGLPLLTNEKGVCDIVGDVLEEREGEYCVLTSPSANSNRLIVFASSPSEAQTLLRELGAPLKKHFRHRALLIRVNSPDSPEDLIPVSEHLAARLRCTSLLVHGLPRLAAQNARAQLRELIDPSVCSLELKWNAKRFLGHGVVLCKDWPTCMATYKVLQNAKFGNVDVKVKFLAK